MTMTWLFDHALISIGVLLGLWSVTRILRERKSSQATVAWLLLIVLVPYLGIPLYLTISRRKLSGGHPQASWSGLVDDHHTVPLDEAPALDRMLRGYHRPGATTGNSVTLLSTGQQGYQGLCQVIERATETLCIQSFIFANDRVGRDVLNLLVQKASRGVTVRVLIDRIGSFHTPVRFFNPLQEAGGNIAYFNPLFHNPLRAKTNLRNHRKIAIADTDCAMAGGMNIVEADMTPVPVTDQWSDLSFLVAGPAVRQYAAIFRQDWQFATDESIEWAPVSKVAADGEAIVQVVPSGPDVEDDPLYDAILTGVFLATDRIWIVTPYFVPTEALTNALVIACRRGIDVRINVPAKSNHPLSDWAGAAALRDIQAAGGRILRYTDGMVHAKLMIVDQQVAMAGSANMDMRSLLINSEVMQFSYTANEIAAVEEYMIGIAAASVEGISQPGRGRQLIEGALRILAPQI